LTESNEANNTYNVVQVTVTAGSSPVAQASAASSVDVQDNFVLAPMSAGQSSPGGISTDHAQLTELASLYAAGSHQLVAATDSAGAHFVFADLPNATQHHFGDYHLV
jgi:hypothetical protein